jgi:hypothetical protein
MKNNKILLMAAILLAAAYGAAAQIDSPRNSPIPTMWKFPEKIVQEVYKMHAGDLKSGREDRILNSRSRRNLDKYFEKKLADLIWKDLTAKRDESGVIDFDPFYNTQDPQVTNLRIARAEIENNKAIIRVTFENSGALEKITYILSLSDGRWKIADIEYRDGKTLLEYFRDAQTKTGR